jgi:transcriptional regulator with XRE-family HTH domain
MHSRKKTPVAVLRLELGLTVDEFAALIGKSISAVTSLETGRLALSPDTALVIATETGVALDWLLDGNPKEKPYVIEPRNGPRERYTRELFEKIQAAKSKGPQELPNDLKFTLAINTICPWISVLYKASKDGQLDLAVYLMGKAIDELAERFGKDDEAVLQATEKVRIKVGDEEYMIVDWYGKKLGIFSSPEAREKRAKGQAAFEASKEEPPKSSPLPPSIGNAHRGGARKSASPRHRRRDVPASVKR